MAELDFKSSRTWVAASVLALLAAVPLYAYLIGQSYYLTLFSRIMIYALAALALNFILGFAGLASLGHAFYLGVGAYAVSILEFHGVTNGWWQLGAALVAGTLFACAVGSVVVRLSGMTFIMITLAFSQMGYFLAITLKVYGGEDGRSIDTRSAFGILDLSNNYTFYYFIFGILLFFIWFFSRCINSKFGMVLRGCKANERRMLALGFSINSYKLLAYVISALVCVLAGFLLANLTKYASPSYMQWTVSADLIIMALLGGISTLFGPVVGAMTFLLLEEVLSQFRPGIFPRVESLITEHWLALIGLFIIFIVLTAKQGIYGYFGRSQK